MQLSSSSSTPQLPIIIIFLTLHCVFQDLNTPFLCSSLHEIGVTVKKVSLVRDDVDAIAQEAPALARDHDIVISCGGIGECNNSCLQMSS